jgi:aspartyl-tRNA(Asn)/glutamyl-tRNA(Gln) amidotransferase subunit C
MILTPKDVSYVADLANLELTSEEQERMLRDLNSILGYIETLSELNTENVAPMTQVTIGAAAESASSSKAAFSLRPDAKKPSLSHELAIANSPEKHPDFFKVPKVIER